MPLKICCLLLVDSDEHEVAVMRKKLELSQLNLGDVKIATNLAEALTIVTSDQIDVVLLSLDLSDSKSLDTLRAMRAATESVIIVLSQVEDEVLGIESIKAGADDFLVKGDVSPHSLRASIIHSTTRHNIRATACRIQNKLDALSVIAGGR